MPDVVLSEADEVQAADQGDKRGRSRAQVRRWGAALMTASLCGALAACSHGSSSDDETSSSAAQASSSSSSALGASSAEATQPPATQSDNAAGDQQSGGAKLGADIPTVPDSNETPSSGPKPINGKPGSEQDVESIKDALGHYGDTSGTVRHYYESTKAYTCKDRIAAHPEVFSDENINSLPNESIDKMGLAGSIPKFNNISNLKVDGDRATASVNTTFNGATSTGTMLFTKEDGQWKVCSD